MTLQDIFDELTYGELSQLAVSGRENPDGTPTDEPQIPDEDRPAIIRHINTALTAIYTRFRLREKSVIVQLLPGKINYVLDKRFAITNTESDVIEKYLLDTVDDPFDNSLIKVEQVSALAQELDQPAQPHDPWKTLPLNEPKNVYAVRTPSLRTLLLPEHFGVYTKTPTRLKVDYRAKHEAIDIYTGCAAPSMIDIELPGTHLQALLFHVASRIMNPTGMVEEFHSGNSWYAKYESECARLEQENIAIDNFQENSHFVRQGFV